jgi:hypothetical protein
MKLRTTTILLALILFVAFPAMAQSGSAFKGTITYNVTYPDANVSAAQAASMPQTVTLKLNGNKTRAEIDMAEISQILLLDSDAKSTIILVNINGQKAAINPRKGNERAPGKEPIMEPAGETKEIAGYVCKKANIHFGDERTKANPIEVYYSDEIGNNKIFYDNEYRNLTGIPLEFRYKMQGMNMLLTATKVESGRIANREFEVPSDYKEMTPDELRQLFGGGK